MISQLQEIIEYLEQIGQKVTTERLNESISLYNENRRLIRKLYDRRSEEPWQIPTHEAYLVLRAGNILEVTEHNQFLRQYMDSVEAIDRKPIDNIRVLVIGAFCEQPSLSLIRIMEQAGCYIVDDDFMLGNRYLDSDVDTGDDPLKALSDAYLKSNVPSSCRFEEYKPKSERLLRSVKDRRAEGVIVACPSFCDPALEDAVSYQRRLEAEGIRHLSLQYAEDMSQFASIREQIGTFTDSIRLWEL